MLHSSLCITKTEICVMKSTSSLQRGKRKTRIYRVWTIMIQKERDREREEILICSFVMIFMYCQSEEDPIAEVHAHPNLYLQHTTTYHWCSLRSFSHVHRPWVLSSEGNNCNHDCFILAKPHSNPDTVPYAATEVLWYDTNHRLLQKQKEENTGTELQYA